jgi:hypothetical protein
MTHLRASCYTAEFRSSPEIYVDDSFAGTFGDPVSPTHPIGAPVAILGINAFTTINEGIQAAQATGTVYVADGSYTEIVAVDRAVTLDGESNSGTIVQAPPLAVPPTPPNGVVRVMAADAAIDDMRIVVNQTDINFGVYCPATFPFDNLQVTDNVFVSNETATPALPFDRRTTAIAIEATNAPALNHTAFIRGNQIIQGTGGTGISGVSTFARGVWSRQGVPVIGGPAGSDGNTITASFQDILCQFPTTGNVLIQNNDLLGAGLDITEPNAGAGMQINVFGNYIETGLNPDNGNVFAQQGALLKHNYFARPILFNGNTIVTRNIGLYTGGARDVTISGNDFVAQTGITDFIHVLVDTDWPGTGVFPAFTPVPANNTVIENNTFNSAAAPGGTGLAFRYGVSAGNVRPLGAMTVGTDGNENTFGADLDYFIALDSDTANAVGSPSPLDLFNFLFTSAYTSPAPGRTVLPWSNDIDITQNLFEVPVATEPADMTAGGFAALELGLWHDPDDAPAGLLLYGGIPLFPEVYVDDSFAGTFGDPVSPTHPIGAPTAFIGLNAFTTINDGRSGGASYGHRLRRGWQLHGTCRARSRSHDRRRI